MYAEFPEAFLVARNESRSIGYLAGRPGTKAFQIGPCLATAEAGKVLLSAALQRHAGKHVFIDVPDDNTSAVQFVEKAGLKAQRQLWRMRRGEPLTERIENIWASSGPEKG
jgi:hypothetical protein